MTVSYRSFNECCVEIQNSTREYIGHCEVFEYDTNCIEVALIHAKVIGILIYGEPSSYYKNVVVGKPVMYLRHINVLKEHRRQGIATSLIEQTLIRLQNLGLFVEIKMPREGEPDIYRLIKGLNRVKELSPYSLEKETYLRYIIEHACNGARGDKKTVSP